MILSTLLNTCVRNVQAWAGEDCLLCGGEGGPELLCAACIAELPALPRSCPRCALPSLAGAVCGSCLTHPPHFDATLALWRYEFPCDGLVQALKYRARLALAGFFARSLRVKHTPPQTELPYEERAKNVRGAFLCKLDLSGASVAVLDDVMTTGATLNELARALKRAGAARVENLVIARTVSR